MTTPKAIQDKIAMFEAEIAHKQEEINRYSTTIASLQERVLAECRAQDAIQNNLDLLKFAIQAYDDEEPPVETHRVDLGRPIGTAYMERGAPEEVEPPMKPFIGDVETVSEAEEWGGEDTSDEWEREPAPEPTPQPEAAADVAAPIKDQVLRAMAWMHGPVKVSEVAKELSLPSNQVSPVFGHLSREKRIKPAPQGTGWIRTGHH